MPLSRFLNVSAAAFFLVAVMTSFFLSPAEASAASAADQEMFQQANQFYRAGQFKEAAGLYKQLSEKNPEDAGFDYNLGNALYRSGALGEAILAYERARLNAPRSDDIRYNLKYVKGLLEYRVEDKRNWYVKMGESILQLFHEKEIYLFVLIVYGLFMGAWLMALRKGRHSWGWLRKTLLGLLLLGIFFAVLKNVETRVMRDAIVLAEEAEVRYGPSLSDQVAFRLGEGLKVYVVDSRKDWSRILLVSGESGWVRDKDIEKVLRQPQAEEKGKTA